MLNEQELQEHRSSRMNWIGEPWKVFALANGAMIAALLIGSFLLSGPISFGFALLGSVAAWIFIRKVATWTR